MLQLPKDKHVIMFDGVCNLCNGFVTFVIKRDRHNQFLFTSLQSEIAQQILVQFPLNKEGEGVVSPSAGAFLESVILLTADGQLYKKSTAALIILKTLGGGWKLLYAFRMLPRFLRDAVYSLVARYRYTFFGRRDQCMVPTPELNAKFLK